MRKISLLICLAACHPDDEGEGLPLFCATDQHCPESMVCDRVSDDVCLNGSRDPDCQREGGRCLEIGAERWGLVCQVDDWCPGGMVCLEGQCYWEI